MKGSQGNVIARRDFKPFGEEMSSNTGEHTITAKYGTADNLRQKFTTYQRDEETGLDFAEARMYENRHGRFTAVDPLLGSGKSYSGDNLGVVYLKKGVNETLTQEQYDAAIQGQTPVAGVFGSFGIARGGLSPTFLPEFVHSAKGN
ncbi:MAG: hypothetical protein IPJ30_09965 [Acidobacteria bacterium]|nr:hypothetical protein [Acidobacteriota bacterium]